MTHLSDKAASPSDAASVDAPQEAWLRDALRCRCLWRGERCENQATEEDGLCNWCCTTQRSMHRLRLDPHAVVISDTEVAIGGGGQTHDVDPNKPASTPACWYPDADRVVLDA